MYFLQLNANAISIFAPQAEPSWLDKTQTALVNKANALFNRNDESTMNPQTASLKMNRVSLDHIRGQINPQWADCFADKFWPIRPQNWRQVQRIRKLGSTRPPIVLVQIGDLYFVCEGLAYINAAREVGATALDALVTVLS